MQRGEIWSVDFAGAQDHEIQKARPAIIVSRDAINSSSNVVIVVPCTTYRAGVRLYPSQVLLEAGAGGLPNRSIVLCEQIRAESKRRFRQR